ncbi:hypothetical protein D5085_17870 [Ectothiorhodospiraceae bacterium BW-2]|nr:hypothetical protein D5085_17870 [Ectothiorhodospiraceae bacterium BW-2]
MSLDICCYQIVLDHLTTGVMLLDEHHTILIANTPLAQLFHHTTTALRGQSYQQLTGQATPPDSEQKNKCCLTLPLEGGTRRTLEIKRLPLASPPSCMAGYQLLTATDITVQKEQQRQSEQTMLALIDAENAESLFMSNMSHELRTPIHGISGMLQLIANEISPDSERGHEYIMQAWNKSQELTRVVDTILDFSHISAADFTPKVAPFSLNWLLMELIDEYRQDASHKGLTLELQHDTTLPEWLLGDRIRLQQVLINLLSNAIKFTIEGQISLATHALTSDEEGSCRIRFSISDSGIGIEAQHLESIFKPFWQVERTRQRRFSGTGLGLTLSEQIIRNMGSELRVESEPNRGSCFYFELTLPLSTTTRPPSTADIDALVESDLFDDDDTELFTTEPAPAPRHNSLKIADEAKIVQLQQLMGDRFTTLLTTFCQDASQKIDRLKQCQTPACRHDLLIALRGSSAAVSATELEQLCHHHEQQLRQNPASEDDSYDNIVIELIDALARFENYSQTYLSLSSARETPCPSYHQID